MKMSNAANEWLAEMFQADVSAADYFDRFKLYAEVGLGLPVKPYWAPLSEVWAVGAKPSPTWPSGNGRGWAEAYFFVRQLHQQFKAARGDKAG